MKCLCGISKFINFHINGDVEFILNYESKTKEILNDISLNTFIGEVFLFKNELLKEKILLIKEFYIDNSMIDKYKEFRIIFSHQDVKDIDINENNIFFIINSNYPVL
jgi:hypothetical protein